MKVGTNKLNQAVEVSNAMADTFAFNSSPENYGPTFKRHKAIGERSILKFKSKYNEVYNDLFSITWLDQALSY